MKKEFLLNACPYRGTGPWGAGFCVLLDGKRGHCYPEVINRKIVSERSEECRVRIVAIGTLGALEENIRYRVQDDL